MIHTYILNINFYYNDKFILWYPMSDFLLINIFISKSFIIKEFIEYFKFLYE